MSSLIEYSSDLESQTQPLPLPVNTYPARIEGAEVKDNKENTGKYLQLIFMVSPDSYPADYIDGDPDGTRLIFNRTPVGDTPMARWRMRKLRVACGLPPGGSTVDVTEFLGLTVNVAVSHQDWEGEKRAQVDKILGV